MFGSVRGGSSRGVGAAGSGARARRHHAGGGVSSAAAGTHHGGRGILEDASQRYVTFIALWFYLLCESAGEGTLWLRKMIFVAEVLN